MKYVTLCGMSRCGNHAIVRWLVPHWEQAGYQVHFYNNATKDFLHHLEFVMGDRSPTSRKVLMVSLEDFNAVMDARIGSLTRVADHNIVLLRDPLNLFASRIAGLGPDRGVFLGEGEFDEERRLDAERQVIAGMPPHIETYMNHWREFTGATNFLHNKVAISYNRWVSEESYRRGLIEGMGLEFTDSGFAVRADSSFGSGQWSTGDYLKRWRDLWYKPVFAPVRDNPNLIDIARSMGVDSRSW